MILFCVFRILATTLAQHPTPVYLVNKLPNFVSTCTLYHTLTTAPAPTLGHTAHVHMQLSLLYSMPPPPRPPPPPPPPPPPAAPPAGGHHPSVHGLQSTQTGSQPGRVVAPGQYNYWVALTKLN